MAEATRDRLLRAQALVSGARRGAKVATGRHDLVSNAEVLFGLAEAIERGETEFWGMPIGEVVRNIAVAIAESASSGLKAAGASLVEEASNAG